MNDRPYFTGWCLLLTIVVIIVAAACCLTGCDLQAPMHLDAASTVEAVPGRAGEPRATTAGPAARSAVSQLGAANIADAVDIVTDVETTGLRIDHALPIGLIPLLAWIIWLSHRRELKRLGTH